MKKWLMMAGLAAAISVPAMAADNNAWQIDPNHSTAQFVVRHLMISERSGRFHESVRAPWFWTTRTSRIPA